jgi:hypothetical protein
MQYTLRDIPRQVDEELRAWARREGKSLNRVVLETLARALGISGDEVPQRDLGDIAGTWVKDSKVERALAEQRQVDPDLWR